MMIRDYEGEDAPRVARLFYETVRSVNRADYSEEQVRAWAPGVPTRRSCMPAWPAAKRW